MQLNTCTILLVDDETNIQNSIKRILRSEPYFIITASSAQEGLEKFKEYDIQLVVSDFKMPGMNGVDFLKEIRRMRPECIRIILSGYADSAAVSEGLKNRDINLFINKPWKDDDLKDIIRRGLAPFF
ncbi:response regulator [bacterium]|nr:response regulator [bacterium]